MQLIIIIIQATTNVEPLFSVLFCVVLCSLVQFSLV